MLNSVVEALIDSLWSMINIDLQDMKIKEFNH